MGLKSQYDDTFEGEWNANTLLIVICSSLAGYNALELLLLVFTTFNVYKGLYFWSLLVATFGIIPYLVGLNLVYFGINTTYVGWILCSTGWVFMVTGQSVVLYSRLGVVLGKGYDNLLKFVKWMIIIDGTILHSVTTGKLMRHSFHHQSDRLSSFHFRHPFRASSRSFPARIFLRRKDSDDRVLYPRIHYFRYLHLEGNRPHPER